jgi:hypothetical protein
MVMRYAHSAPDHRLAAVERMEDVFHRKATATKTATNGASDIDYGTDAVQ